jgi:hypothetical protein
MRLEIYGPDQLLRLRAELDSASQLAIGELQKLPPDPVAALASIKFLPLGRHPFENRRLNIVEQVNQTFTGLASLLAVEKLWSMHQKTIPLVLNFGTSPGWDIESLSPGNICAEVFAATSPNSNQKLAKDIARMATAKATNRYVFFICPGIQAGRQPHLERGTGVEVWALDEPALRLLLTKPKQKPSRLTKPEKAERAKKVPGSGRKRRGTTEIGYRNRNGQTVMRSTDLPGNDHVQKIYVLSCDNCSTHYGANGSDLWQRKCPKCQDGMPGLPY